MHAKMNDKRFRKLDAAQAPRRPLRGRGQPRRAARLVAGAASPGVVPRGVDLRAKAEGLDVKLLVPILLYPIAEEIYATSSPRSARARGRARHQGQLYRMLRMFVDVPPGVQSLRRSGANPIQPLLTCSSGSPRAALALNPPAPDRLEVTCHLHAPCHLQAKDFKSELKPIWCPGCGDYGVVQALYRALAAIGRPPHEIAFISGIGCSSRIPGYTTAYGFNSVHGRALPIAQGIKLANPELLVLVAGGDGDGFSIGGGHVPTPSAATWTSRTS
jgi:hypothetical protein